MIQSEVKGQVQLVVGMEEKAKEQDNNLLKAKGLLELPHFTLPCSPTLGPRVLGFASCTTRIHGWSSTDQDRGPHLASRDVTAASSLGTRELTPIAPFPRSLHV